MSRPCTAVHCSEPIELTSPLEKRPRKGPTHQLVSPAIMMIQKNVDDDKDEGENVATVLKARRQMSKTWDQEGPQSAGLENIVWFAKINGRISRIAVQPPAAAPPVLKI